MEKRKVVVTEIPDGMTRCGKGRCGSGATQHVLYLHSDGSQGQEVALCENDFLISIINNSLIEIVTL
jgi:hypothetical protein